MNRPIKFRGGVINRKAAVGNEAEIGDLQLGLSGLNLALLLGVMNVINLLMENRNELRRLSP